MWWLCVDNFDTLKKGQLVVVGDDQDARRAHFYFQAEIEANHRSQRPYRFQSGYIRFRNGRYFDRHRRVLTSRLKRALVVERPAHIFLCSREIALLWQRQVLKKEIENWKRSALLADRMALKQLMGERVGHNDSRVLRWDAAAADKWISVYAEVLGLQDLRLIVGTLNAGGEKPECASRIAA